MTNPEPITMSNHTAATSTIDIEALRRMRLEMRQINPDSNQKLKFAMSPRLWKELVQRTKADTPMVEASLPHHVFYRQLLGYPVEIKAGLDDTYIYLVPKEREL